MAVEKAEVSSPPDGGGRGDGGDGDGGRCYGGSSGNQQGGGGKAAAPARLEAVVVVAVEGMLFASPGRKSAEDHLPADDEVRRNIGFVEQVYALYKQYTRIRVCAAILSYTYD